MKSYHYRGFIIYFNGEWFQVHDACYKTLKQAKNEINQYLAEKAWSAKNERC